MKIHHQLIVYHWVKNLKMMIIIIKRPRKRDELLWYLYEFIKSYKSCLIIKDSPVYKL